MEASIDNPKFRSQVLDKVCPAALTGTDPYKPYSNKKRNYRRLCDTYLMSYPSEAVTVVNSIMALDYDSNIKVEDDFDDSVDRRYDYVSSGVSEPKVVLYKDINKGGTQQQITPGSNISDLDSKNIGNDSVSSMYVPNHAKVHLYDDEDYRGDKHTFTYGTRNLTSSYSVTNDDTQSVKTERRWDWNYFLKQCGNDRRGTNNEISESTCGAYHRSSKRYDVTKKYCFEDPKAVNDPTCIYIWENEFTPNPKASIKLASDKGIYNSFKMDGDADVETALKARLLNWCRTHGGRNGSTCAKVFKHYGVPGEGDTHMRNYCAANPKEDVCSCLQPESHSTDENALGMPTCFLPACVARGYKTRDMIGVPCPDLITSKTTIEAGGNVSIENSDIGHVDQKNETEVIVMPQEPTYKLNPIIDPNPAPPVYALDPAVDPGITPVTDPVRGPVVEPAPKPESSTVGMEMLFWILFFIILIILASWFAYIRIKKSIQYIAAP